MQLEQLIHGSRATEPAAHGRGAARRTVVRAVVAAVVVVATLSTAGVAQAATYHVKGTGSTLRVHSAPSLSAPVVGGLADGTAIDIVCQTRGDQVVGSTMWDEIDSPVRGYVADWYTDTPGVNAPTAGLPTCSSVTNRSPVRVCNTQTTALTGWQVYTVCLTATDSYNGGQASGYVSGADCNINTPTGSALGYFCHGYTKGSYWNSSLGAWEDWLNYRVSRIPTTPPYTQSFSNCVYLRVDTRPNGYTTYQNFAVTNRGLWTTC